MKTAHQPVGVGWSPDSPPIQDRPSGLYHSNQEVPSWMRKGHTQKPNPVVRAIYVVFDFFADFGPMVSWIFRLIKKTVVDTWGLLVRFFLATVNIAILGGILYVSVGHSHDMLIQATMSGIAAWVFVGVWETVFVYCSIVIDRTYQRGKKVGGWVWTGFFMGWIFVELSNILAMADNWLGISLGAATPVLLIVMKKVFAYQFQKDAKTKTTDPGADTAGVDTRQTDSVDTAGVDTRQTDSVDTAGVDTRQTDSVDTAEVDTRQTDSVDTAGVDTRQTDSVDTAGVDTRQTDSVDTAGVDTRQTDSVDTAEVDTRQTDSVDTAGVDTRQTDSVDTAGVDTRQTDSVDTAEEGKVTHMHDPNRKQTAYEIALKYFEEHGKFPSYRDLGDLAGCSKDTAGKAIKKAKERFKKTG